MKHAPTVDQVLDDIEFELIQGAISRDDLGQSIQAVRQFLNKTRGEVFQSGRRSVDYVDAVSRQFQINDMLVTLLQETAARIQRLEATTRRAERTTKRSSSGSAASSSPPPYSNARSTAVDRLPWPGLDPCPEGKAVHNLESADQLNNLEIELDPRPVGLPLVGSTFTRLRMALHSLVLFYISKLASRQRSNNQVLFESIRELSWRLASQQELVQALDERLAALQACVGGGQGLVSDPPDS